MKVTKNELKRLIENTVDRVRIANEVYRFVKDNYQSDKFSNSDEMKKIVKEKFGWNDDIENSAWQAWEDVEGALKESLNEDTYDANAISGKVMTTYEEYSKNTSAEDKKYAIMVLIDYFNRKLKELK